MRFARICAALFVSLLALLVAGAGGALGAPRPIDLALRFQPHLFFDGGERWRPTDVDAFLAEPGHQLCTATPAACTPLVSAAQLTVAGAYLDLRGTRPDGLDAAAPDLATCPRSWFALLDCDLAGRSVIYAHVRRAGDRIAIDYWWFLRYNAYFPDLHEGDWEGVTVILDGDATRVRDVHFAAHTTVWQFADDVPRIVDGRVKVYVSNGDHASYPRPCVILCRQTGGLLPESHFGGQRSWIGNAAAGCRRQCVRLLPESNGAPSSWDAWNGRWGVPLSQTFAPPATPSFQRRYLAPFAAHRSGRHVFAVG
jgi:hypothetical protein